MTISMIFGSNLGGSKLVGCLASVHGCSPRRPVLHRDFAVGFDRGECIVALRTIIALYRQLRPATAARRDAAETAAVAYMNGITA